ncbi:unnamed protein product [Brachionus calyciflorus]|uniref:Protein kinase domain-containing protein n=1 Tax=Brachionus calyciflorus TaxID=104777 RepID=A0A813N6M6_9BILA|nr:unnamed protein product [Brachionus calyciflorus]
MAFLDKLKKKLPFANGNGNTPSFLSPFINSKNSQTSAKKKHSNLITDRDPTLTWEIVSEIGDGAFGKVYKVKNKQSGVLAAAKIVEKCTDDDLDDYMVEIDILSECNHKNILKIYEAYYFDSKLWILIEFCSGGAVDSLMFDLDKPLNEPQIQYVIRETLEALCYLHENCFVIHRDMKAGNILLTDKGEVKLADFGVSAKNTSQLQRRYSFIGTPYWMSPEIIACETDKDMSYDFRTDIWSLGVTCIELAEKEPPHNELNPTRVMMKIRKSDSPKLKYPNQWSKNFQDFLTKCLNKNPEERLTARDLLKHPFIASYTSDEKPIKLLLGEKNATINVVEEVDTDDHSDSNKNPSLDTSKVSNTLTDDKVEEQTETKSNLEPEKIIEKIVEKIPEKIEEKIEKSPPRVLKPIAPPPPVPTIVTSNEPVVKISPKKSPEKKKIIEDKVVPNLDELSEFIFEDICDEVIKCDDRAPSVPDVILQVISEILTETSQSAQEEQTPVNQVARVISNYTISESPKLPKSPKSTTSSPKEEKKDDLEIQKLNRSRTRKTITKTFVVDGQTVTETIKKTVIPEEEERQKKLIEDRKRDLIEHRRNLNEDRRKLVEQTRKQDQEKESLEQDFKEQREKLLREFEIKLAHIYQLRKSEIERCEEAQAVELKTTLKRLKHEQDKSLRFYRDQLKDEFKMFKKELETNSSHILMAKDHRDLLKKQKEKELIKREEEYQLSQISELAEEEKRILKLQRQQLIHLETTSLLEKQNLIRTREAAIWELERLQMEQRYNVVRKHVRDFFYLQRHLMLSKQEKDLEHLRQLNTKLEEDLIRRQNEEKRLFMKSLRQEQRSRREMYRRSLYIIPVSNAQSSLSEKLSADEEKRKLKEFEEREKERFENELQRLNIRHIKQLEEYRVKADNIMKDLDDEQRLKRKQLVDAETKCLRDVDERYNQEYAYWQNRLRSRKQKLEDDFKREESERSIFYQNFSNNLQTSNTIGHNFQSYQRPMSPPHHSNGSNSHFSPTSTSSYVSNPYSSQKQIYHNTLTTCGNSSSSSSTHSNVLPTESVYSFNAPEAYMYSTHQSQQHHVYQYHHNHHQNAQNHQTANNQR